MLAVGIHLVSLLLLGTPSVLVVENTTAGNTLVNGVIEAPSSTPADKLVKVVTLKFSWVSMLVTVLRSSVPDFGGAKEASLNFVKIGGTRPPPNVIMPSSPMQDYLMEH